MNRSSWIRIGLLALVAALVAVPASAMAKPKSKTVEVCKHGCDYRTIQDAVDHTGKNATINVHPGKYKEGVLVSGAKHDGLTIQGTKSNAKKVILEGKNAKAPDGQPANNGIEGDGVDGMRVLNLWARNYLANGIFIHDCNGYLMKNLRASFNRAYGLFAFDCKGGRMTKSVGYGQGDSAYYVGATPPQAKPKKTRLDHLDGHENVLGYSGTNSRYVTIEKSNFYNNGVGVVPNTLDSEPFEPSADGVIQDNNIFWNNFNYFLPNSRVKTVSSGLGEVEGIGTIQYPTGAGVVLLGSDGWKVQDNNIFGNFKWGAAIVSDPFNEGDDAIARNNQFLNNQMGKNGTDTNAVDFFNQGSGTGNCFSGNVSSTFDPSGTATNAQLYPECPTSGVNPGQTGTSMGNVQQFGDLASYVTTDPPENQECSWTRHPHPSFKSYKPLDVTPGPSCP